MYYLIVLVMGAIIVFVSWPRPVQRDSQFPAELTEKRLAQLERGLSDIEDKLARLENNLTEGFAPSSPGRPLSSKGLASYTAIQQDWQQGSSIDELCSRYELLRGEVELILDLMGEGMRSIEPRHIYGVHGNGCGSGSSGTEGSQPG